MVMYKRLLFLFFFFFKYWQPQIHSSSSSSHIHSQTYSRVYENRISPFAQSVLISLTLIPSVLSLLGCVCYNFFFLFLFLTISTRNIPRAVLSGLFIYMAITSLDGNEFFERIMFLFTWERKHWPRKAWAQKVSMKNLLLEIISITTLHRCHFMLQRYSRYTLNVPLINQSMKS